MKNGFDKFDEKVTSLVEKGNELHDNQKYAEALEQYKRPGKLFLSQSPNRNLLTGSLHAFTAHILISRITLRQRNGERRHYGHVDRI